MNFKVQFFKCTKQQYETIIPDSYSFYFLLDTEQVFLGNTQLSNTGFTNISTTVLTNGGNENPTVNGSVITTKTVGDLYFYNKEVFIYGSDNKWHSLGPQLTTLGDLAYKNNATAAYTPEGSVSQPIFSGNTTTITTKGTPSGTISTPTITVTPSTTTVNSITNVGTLPSCTLPVFTANVINENLTLDWTSGSFSQGTLPTKGANTTVATSILSAVSTQPTFTGNQLSSTASYTPVGTITKPTFTGNASTIIVS